MISIDLSGETNRIFFFIGLKSAIKREPGNTSWGITIRKIKPAKHKGKDKLKKDLKLIEMVDAKCERLHDVTIKKIKKKKRKTRSADKRLVKSEPQVVDLLKKHKIFCKQPSEPIVDQETELNKHRHNIRIILKHSNATPFRAYHVDEGYVCCFCDSIIKKTSDLKTHTNDLHTFDKDAFKENSTSIFTYVVKLDITDLRCKICDEKVKTLEDFIEHLQAHDVSIHTDIKNQIVCFKFDSEAPCCMYCGKEFSNFKFLLEHMNVHYKNYSCEDCNSGFINFRMLVAHAEGDDLTVGEVKCPICDEVFEKYARYKQHELLAHTGFNLTSHECRHCKELFKSDDSLREHVEEKHEGRHEYKCGECSKVYDSKRLLIGHVRRAHLHEDKEFKCDVCERQFNTRQQLQVHMLTHSITRQFQCDICALMFKCKKTLERHIYTHQLKGKHKCLFCEESFIRMSHLNHHVRQDHLKDALTKCDACGKVLYQSQLKKHTALRHSELRTYKCQVCSVECESKLALVLHMGSHKNLKPEGKKFECRACGKLFDRQIYVTKHTQRVHMLEKRFVCDHCGKQFADCTTLKNHMAQHGPGPSFQCFGCSRMFKTKKTMLNHARNHMDERKVKCEICQHAFIYPYLLRDHMKQVHRL